MLDTIGGHYLDEAVGRIKGGKTYRGTGDNWDLKILKSHMRKDIQNEDLHMFSSNIIENRLNFSRLENSEPKGTLRNINRSSFSPCYEEITTYRQAAIVLVGRIFVEHFPKFSVFAQLLPSHIKHEYSTEMSTKSKIISMPIINANEASYGDCVKILRQYESWIGKYFPAKFLNA